MPDRDPLSRPRPTTEWVVLHDYDERTAPPTDPVLMVCVIGDAVFLQLAEMEEDNKTTTFKRIGRSFQAYGPDLLAAISAFRTE